MNSADSDSYFDLLFKKGALVCTGDQFANSVHDRVLAPRGPFVCVNELNAGTTRSDENVACFRNFLIEIDTIPLDKQAKYIEQLALPYSAAVYSGGKSIHYIISLEEPCANVKEYRELASFLIDDIVTLSDKNNKNPSRFTRTPNYVRPDTGRVQEVLDLRKRVTNEELAKFLAPYAQLRRIKQKAARKAQRVKAAKQKQALKDGLTLGALDLINNRTKRFLEAGAQEGDRHHELKLAMLDLRFNGMDLAQIEELVTPAAHLSGIGTRGDVQGLIAWFERSSL